MGSPLFPSERISDDFGDVRFNGKKWSELAAEDKKILWDYTVPVEFVDVTDSTLVNQVFDRLNRNVKKLNAQELRHARFIGWFARKVEEEVSRIEWRDLGLVTPARERRMADAQFLSELLLVVLRQAIQGFDQASLDAAYADLDGYDQDPDPVAGYMPLDEFEESYTATLDVLKAIVRSDARLAVHLRTLMNLYTLWGVITLHRQELGAPVGIATRYCSFMEAVARVPEVLDASRRVQPAPDPSMTDPASYWTNSRGASTDLPQRRARHAALLAALRPVQ